MTHPDTGPCFGYGGPCACPRCDPRRHVTARRAVNARSIEALRAAMFALVPEHLRGVLMLYGLDDLGNVPEYPADLDLRYAMPALRELSKLLNRAKQERKALEQLAGSDASFTAGGSH